MADRLLGVLGHQALKLGLGLLMLEMGGAGAGKDAGKLRPGIGRAHIDDADGLDPRLGRLDPKQLRLLAVLDTAPELALGGDNEVLVERVGVGQDLYPFAAPGDHREHRGPGAATTHMLCCSCGHVLGQSPLLRERPRQHELGFEHRIAARHPAIQRGCHPLQCRVKHPLLDIGDHLPGIGLVPAPIEVLGRQPRVGRSGCPTNPRARPLPLLPPQPHQGCLILAHDDPGVRAADEIAPSKVLCLVG